MAGDDAVNEEELILCCALCCANCSLLTDGTCISCSGKVGLCCLQCEVCCKPGAPCLPCCCFGPKCENDGCSIVNTQIQCCCCVVTSAIPCNDEVPIAVSALGLTVFPKCGCCVKQRVSDYINGLMRFRITNTREIIDFHIICSFFCRKLWIEVKRTVNFSKVVVNVRSPDFLRSQSPTKSFIVVYLQYEQMVYS